MSTTLEMPALVRKGYRLSPQQARLWLSQQGSVAYCAQAVISLEGLLRPERLRDALRRVVQQHEILRTVFQDVPGMKIPVQVVTDDGEPSWRKVELEDLDDMAQRDAIERICCDELARTSDRVRALLVEMDSQRHLLVLTLPALCCDTPSMTNLLHYLVEAYAGADVSAEETVQYVQFAEWQNELFEDEESEGRRWWKEQSVADVLILPLEGEETGSATRIERQLSQEDTDAIEKLALEKDTTPAVVLLACWQILLSRLSGRSEFPLRLMCGGRIYEEMHDALGLYARWPRIECQVEQDSSFSQIVERTAQTVAHTTEWQEFYFASEDDAVQANDIGFEFSESPETREVNGLSFTLQRQQATSERLKLKLSCLKAACSSPTVKEGSGNETKQWLHFDYDPSVYTAENTQRLAGRFVTLLSSLLENSERAVKHAQLLDEVELDCVLRQWARTRAERIPDKCLHELFEEQVWRTPDRVAVVSGDAQLTFRELDTRANQLANMLQQLGVGPESLVGMCQERSVTLMVSLLGILKAGGAYVPLDPGQPARRLGLILNDAGIDTVLTEERLKEKFADTATKIICIDSEREQIEQQSSEKPLTTVNNHNPAYVIFTSGSTGQPKGVSISHRSVVNLAQALAHAVYAGTNASLRVSVNAPLAFDSSVKQFVQIIYGHTLCIVPEEIRPDGEALLKFIREQHIDALDCTPSQLRLLHEAGFGDGNASDPSIVLVGGEAIDELLWATLCSQSQIDFYNVYGPTECTVDATVCRATSPARPRIGRPITNIEVYVLDRNLKPTPVGVMGEIYIGGDCVARGYSNHPDLTAGRFIPHPFSDREGARLYRTGDRGRFLPGGELECAGRVDHQVKLRGNRVELGEIEAALAEHEAVNEVVVILREDQPGDQRLVAYFVAARSTELAPLELREYLSKKLPEYMLPAAIVPLKALPLTRNGKVDRFNLPAPDEFAVQPGKNFVGPRTPVEEVVADIWAQLFRVKQVSTQDNFFELGGHSLLATQVIARVRKAFKVEVAVRCLFESPTVAALSQQIELEIKAGSEKRVAPIERVSREDPIPASFAQQRLWFVHELMPENSGYQLHLSLRVKGALDVAVLQRTFTEIVSRHEILRTTFAVRDQKLVQVIAEPSPFKLAVEDLSTLPPAEREERALKLATEEGYRPFDLKRDVVLRATLWCLAPDEHILGLTTHHIASDEWSINVLVREALTLYESLSNGRPSPLAPLPIQYADYAVWQRSRFDDERLAAELAYWKKQLGDGPYVLDLPTDRPRPAVQTSRGAHQTLNFAKPLIDTLKAVSREEEATLFMAVLAVYKILLHHNTRQSSLIVGTPIADRPQIETEELIGFFVNMLVMRTDLSGDPSFRELLRRVREVALGAYAHQSLPFDKLVEELAPARDLSRNPLFQAAFSFDSSTPEELKLSQLEIQPIEFEGRPIRFDLVVALRDTGDGLTGAIQYNSDLFNASRMTRMRDHFGMLLANVAANPDAKLSQLIAQLSEADRQHHDQQVLGFKQTRSRMLKNAKVKPVTMPEEKGVAAT